MEGLHHRPELADRAARRLVRGVAPVGREEPHRLIAPVVLQRGRIGEGAVVVERVLGLVHRQELDGGDAEIAQVGRPQRGPRIGAAQRLRHVRVGLGEAAHVHLVDDVVLQRMRRLGADVAAGIRPQHALRRDRAGVDEPVRRARAVGIAVRMRRRLRAMADLPRVGVEQQLVGIETIAGLVDVGEEAGGGARRPGGVVAPVRAEGAIAVADRAGADRRAARQVHLERAVADRVHRRRLHRFGADGRRVEPQLDAFGRRRPDAEADRFLREDRAVSELTHRSWPSDPHRTIQGCDRLSDLGLHAGADARVARPQLRTAIICAVHLDAGAAPS